MDIITLGLLVKIAFALSVADDLTDVKKKLWETTGEVAGAWLDRVLKRLPSSVRDAMRTAERQIKTHQTMLRLDESRQEVALTIAGHLLRDHAPSAAAIVQAAYDAEKLTAQILRDGHTILTEIDDMAEENDAVQAVLTILLRHVLTQADSLQATESLWRKVMQDGQADILAELRRLPDDLFLRSLAGFTLLRANAPLPFRKDILSASELLTARHTTLSLRGREGEMETLLAWATTASPFGVRLITGPGGHGKTRLALELCRRLEQQGWRTGFLLDRLPDLSNIRLADLFDDTRPTLITIDYAAGRMEDVRRFTELADEWGGRLRLLLVEREAGDWWSNRKSLPDPAGALLRGPACIPDPMEVPALPTGIPQAVFADAASHFAPLLGVPLEHVQIPGIWPDDLGLPLFARARALLAVEAARDGTKPPEATQDDILDHLLSREQRVWRSAARLTADDHAKLADIRAIVTLLTLTAPTNKDDAPALVRRLPALASHSGETLNQWLTALRPLYGDGDLLRGLEPDLLGEHLVWRTVKSPTDPLLTIATGSDASEAQAQTALTVLNRLAARKAGAVDWLRAILDQTFDRLAVPAFRVALEQPLPMAALFRGVMGRLSFEQALTLSPLLHEHTTELREIAAQVEQRLVDLTLPSDPEPEVRSFRAQHLNNLSVHLSELGHREQALAAIEEAVGHYRTLAETGSDTFLPALAMSLNNLSNSLSGMGQRERALTAGEEAVSLYRTLAETRPDAFMPDLASAVNNLSVRLSDLGQRERALTAGEEAVGLYRELARTRPYAFLYDLAMSLNNLSNHLFKLEQREMALAAVGEAIAICRILAETRPDALLPKLAGVLITLSNRLSEIGQRERALAAVEEAVGFYRTLTETRPDAFLPDLAAALNTYSISLSEWGQWEKALAAVEEAVSIRRVLAETRPEVFLPVLATSLNNLSNRMSELGQREKALATVEEAVALYRNLAETWPEVFRPDLASALNNLSGCLSDLGQPEKALAVAEEAVSIRRTLAETWPDAFLPDLAGVLITLSTRFSSLGHWEKAVAAGHEALGLYRNLAEAQPDAFLPDLSIVLNNMSIHLSNLGHREKALAAVQEAVAIRRILAEKRPDAFLPDLATSTAVLRNCFRATERFDDALAAAREAASLLFPYFHRLPAAFGNRMLVFYQYYTQSAQEAGQEPDPALVDPIVVALIEHGFLNLPDAEPEAHSPA